MEQEVNLDILERGKSGKKPELFSRQKDGMLDDQHDGLDKDYEKWYKEMQTLYQKNHDWSIRTRVRKAALKTRQPPKRDVLFDPGALRYNSGFVNDGEIIVQMVDFNKHSADFTVFSEREFTHLTYNNVISDAVHFTTDTNKTRWIHLNGISPGLVTFLCEKYNLHPAVLDDLMHISMSEKSNKAENYKTHTFLSVLNLKTRHQLEEVLLGEPVASCPVLYRFFQKYPPDSRVKNAGEYKKAVQDEELKRYQQFNKYSIKINELLDEQLKNKGRRAVRLRFDGSWEYTYPKLMGLDGGKQFENIMGRKRETENGTRRFVPRAFGTSRAENVALLTEECKVSVFADQLSFVLVSPKLLLSFSRERTVHPRISEIFRDLFDCEHFIRQAEDATLILQEILRCVVEEAVEVVETVKDKIMDLECKIMSHANSSDLRDLHMLSAQILVLKLKLEPVQVALSQLLTPEFPEFGQQPEFGTTSKGQLKRTLNEMDQALKSLDLFKDLCENLIGYAFDLMGHKSGSYMEALSVLNVIFLPLTFLTSYYGMDVTMFSVDTNDISAFWKTAVPLTIGAFLLFSSTYMVELMARMGRILSNVDLSRKLKE